MTRTRFTGCAVGAIAIAILASCGELDRRNPFDPLYQITVSLTGPSTANTLGDTLQFQLTTTPRWKQDVVWSSSNQNVVNYVRLSAGRFVVTGEGTATVYAKLGPHGDSTVVTVRLAP